MMYKKLNLLGCVFFLFALFLLGINAANSQDKGDNKQGKSLGVNKVMFSVSQVYNVEKKASEDRIYIHLKEGNKVWFKISQNHLVWIRIVERSKRTKDKIFVEYNNDKYIMNLYDTDAQIVNQISDVSHKQKFMNDLRNYKQIYFEMSPSAFYLNKRSKEYGKKYEILEMSRKNRRQVLFTAHPETHEILDVRLP